MRVDTSGFLYLALALALAQRFDLRYREYDMAKSVHTQFLITLLSLLRSNSASAAHHSFILQSNQRGADVLVLLQFLAQPCQDFSSSAIYPDPPLDGKFDSDDGLDFSLDILTRASARLLSRPMQ